MKVFTGKFIGVGLLLSTLVGFTAVVYAQQPPTFNIAQTLNILDAGAVDGDIVSLSDQNESVVRTNKSYDERMHGVLVARPVMVYRTLDSIPVSRAGIAYVNVTTLGGPIKVGDYITSSEIPGKGQKATEISGYMVGISLASFSEQDGESATFEGNQIRQGKVKVAVGIGPASPILIKATGGVFGTLRQLAQALLFNIATSKQTERIIRYILAALIALLAIYISFRTFGRNVTKGIEAIGRNPLARVSIQSMIMINVILIAAVAIGGIILSLVIISL